MHNIDNIIPTINCFVKRTVTPDWKISKDKSKFHELTFVNEGNLTYVINDTEYKVISGDLIYIPEGTKYNVYTNNRSLSNLYTFNLFFYDQYHEKICLPFEYLIHIGHNEELLELFNEFFKIWIEKKPYYKLKSRSIFMEVIYWVVIFSYNSEQNNYYDIRIKKIKNYILENYNKIIKIKTLSDLVDLNPVYLGALFKKETGLSIKEYITNIRINYAETLLKNDNFSISYVASQSGFDDIYYFSKVFKKTKGIPPSRIEKISNEQYV
ncbi:MAG: AraC family transcriptional regulator [Clostridiales bacterium]